jgi:transposase
MDIHQHSGPELAAYVGLDWADRQHLICLRAADGSENDIRKLNQKPDALHEWIAQLRARFPTGKIGVAIEQSRGAVVHALMMYDFLVLFPINPKALARYREAFTVSGAKDDPSDAEFLMDMLRLHRPRLRAWIPDTEQTRKLQLLVEYRRKLVSARIRHSNRVASLLKMYFPQALDWAGELGALQSCDFLENWPTLAAVQQAPPDQLRDFYVQHRCRRSAVIEQRLAQISAARRLTEDPAIVETLSMAVQAEIAPLRSLVHSIARYDAVIAQQFAIHPDHSLFAGLPGAGPVYAPRLLAAFGEDRSRWEDSHDFLCYSGIAPVTRKSGKSLVVQRRRACSPFLLQTFHEFAAHSIQSSTWARAYYDQLRSRGFRHAAAARSLAYKWIRILYRCWRDRIPYDEQIYLASLRARKSPLAPEDHSE